MSGIKAKFTKSFNGESEVDYANFDNPVYELDATGQPNFDAPHRPTSRPSTFDGIFGGKGDNRKRWIIIGGVAVIVVLVIIIMAAVLGTNAAKANERKADENVAVARLQGSTSYFGTMRLKIQFMDAYKNPKSNEYLEVTAKFEGSMRKTLTNAGMGKDYSGTRVVSLRSGSVIVVYEMTFRGPPTTTPQKLNEALKNQVRDKGFGNFPVDMNSMALNEGRPPTVPTLASTTSKADKMTTAATKSETTSMKLSTEPASSMSQSTKKTPDATTSVQTTTTVPLACGHPIISECASVLGYNTSRRSLADQNAMKSALLQLAVHTSNCYNESKFYMCAIIAPHCYETSSGRVRKFPILPCQQLCHTYKAQCKEELADIDTNGALTCDSYLPYTPQQSRCSYHKTPPAVEVTTTVSPNSTYAEVCYPIHHTYCANIPWKSAFLPNYMGHNTLAAAHEFLSFMQALQDSGMHCHDELHTLICAAVLPKCDANHQRVPPCRSMCLDVHANCSLMLSHLPIHVPISCATFTRDTNCTNVGPPPPPTSCNTTTQYSCLDGEQCIPIGERCNGFPNCNDRSDEIGCANNTACNDGQFKCTVTGACIPNSWKCDAYNDCGDSSDEASCACSEDQFQCTSSDQTMRCINGSEQCDGYYNCFGRQDELNCHNFTCRPDQHKCDNGLCRPLKFVCDGDDDCGDGSDERSCLANETCLESEFKCVNGSRQWGIQHTSCVPKTWQCDTERDCSDGSDEKNCPSFCFPNPCSHGGNCTADVRGFLCECPQGTGGANCEIVEELPSVSCDTPITIPGCKTALRNLHTTTIATRFSQDQVKPFIEPALTKFNSCYEHAAEFLCQYVTPECGSLTFPRFPCKSMCREFKAQCAHELNETRAIDRLIDCDTLLDDHMYPDSQCFKLSHSQATVAPPPALSQPGCEELKVEFCKDLGYNSTYLPNLFNQTHQSVAEWLINQFEHAHSNMPTCNPYLKHFGCAIAVPECNANGTGPIPPCKDLCEAVAFDCGYWMDHMQWKFPFKCDDLPESNDTSVCVPHPAPVRKQGCYGDQFECGSGECIHKTFQCDRFPDCDDESDEESNMCETYWSNLGASTTDIPLIDFFSHHTRGR